MNAKDLITLWGDKDCPLNEYACRQWSGLLNDFYKPRWERYFAKAISSMETGKELDMNAFTKEIKDWEWKWVNTRKDYPVNPRGNSVEEAKKLYQKYRPQVSK